MESLEALREHQEAESRSNALMMKYLNTIGRVLGLQDKGCILRADLQAQLEARDVAPLPTTCAW